MNILNNTLQVPNRLSPDHQTIGINFDLQRAIPTSRIVRPLQGSQTMSLR